MPDTFSLRKASLLRNVAAALMLAAAAPVFAYDANANAKADLQQALATAKVDKKPVLVLFGADWCGDCRALDASLRTSENEKLISKEFVVVRIDVGNFNRNVDIAKQYGNAIDKGIPSAVILSPNNEVLYATRAGELAKARRMNNDGIYKFFSEAAAASTRNKN